MKQYI